MGVTILDCQNALRTTYKIAMNDNIIYWNVDPEIFMIADTFPLRYYGLFWVIGLMLGWSNLFLIEDDYGKLALQSLAFAALAGAVINLIPMGVVTKDGESPNDGLGILKSLFGKG